MLYKTSSCMSGFGKKCAFKFSVYRVLLSTIVAILLLWTEAVDATWVTVVGQAPIDQDNYQAARANARDDAYRQAIEQFGARVSSHQLVKNGQLISDDLSFSSDARIRSSKVIDQYVREKQLYLEMKIDVEEIPNCPTSQARKYKKKVSVLGFSVQSPEQQRVGQLVDIERGLASALNQALLATDSLLVFENSQATLYPELINAPTQFTTQNTLTKAAAHARGLGVQFVISGVVRDLSLEDPSAFSNSVWASWMRSAGKKNINRRFEIELFVHDGFSGSIIWQRTFKLSAPWNTDINQAMGFNSSEFWTLDYGVAVNQLLEGVGSIVSEQLACQPYMARISRIEGKTMHFSSGAASGVRPGDKFSLYRTFNYFDADMLKGTELTNVKTVLTVSQVHPDFATGKVNIDPGRVNIQEDDLLIVW